MFATYAWFLPTEVNLAIDAVALATVGGVLWLRHRNRTRAHDVEPIGPVRPEPARELVDA